MGMGRDLYEKFPAAKAVFDKADDILVFGLAKLCFEGPQELLTQTKNCQLAILVTSIAALEAFRAIVHRPSSIVHYAAGLSLGEYSALVASEAITFEEALLLVAKRAQFMTEAAEKYPGKMVAVLGMDLAVVRDLSQEAGNEIANLNCPGQVVITGKKEDVDKFCVLAGAKGAKRLVELEVSGAFHSTLMSQASVKLSEELKKVNFSQPKTTVISNVTAMPFASPEDIRINLALQVKSSVLWENSVRFLMAQGINKFAEIGPGKTLKGILRKIDPALEVVNIEKAEDIKEVMG